VGAISEREVQACLTDRFGPRTRGAPTPLGPRTWRASIDGCPIVVKHMTSTHRPSELREVMREAAGASLSCPRLVDCVEHEDGWLALFEFVDGRPLRAAGDATRDRVFAWLERLARITPSSAVRNIDRDWLARVSPLGRDDPAAKRTLDDLAAHPPSGAPCLAHGDVAPQNLIETPSGLVLIDWEEAGAARPGFDAGWLLALNRIGAGLRTPRRELIRAATDAGLSPSNVAWFEQLGLLRLQWRMRSLFAIRAPLVRDP
jgi:aminoglycoside phosphotransferase (APT) family kinase protein